MGWRGGASSAPVRPACRPGDARMAAAVRVSGIARRARSACAAAEAAQPRRRPREPDAARQDDHPVGDEDGLGDRVRDQHDRRAGALPEAEQLRVEAFARQGVERAERLVQQQHLRLAHERAGDRRPLAHAARELARVGARRTRSGRPCSSSCARALASRGSATPASSSGKATLSMRRPPGQQARLLEDEADARVGVTYRGAADLRSSLHRAGAARRSAAAACSCPIRSARRRTTRRRAREATPSSTTRRSPSMVKPRLTASRLMASSCASAPCASSATERQESGKRGDCQRGSGCERRLPSPIRTLTVGSLPGDPPSPLDGAGSWAGGLREIGASSCRPPVGNFTQPRRRGVFVICASQHTAA